MKIYVFNLRRFLKYFILAGIIILLACLVCASELSIINVFSTNKELPIYYVDSTERTVAITFDCAWGADDIPKILDTLKNENVYASFFVVGKWAEKYPQAVKMISDAGHDVANHSYSHLRMGAIDTGKISQEISMCGKVLGEISRNKIDLFRPPYGDYNNSVIRIARSLGYHTIQWDVDSLDWKPGISRDEIMSRIMKKVKPGSIILFHNDTPHTANILPSVISSLKKQGYVIKPVSKMILKENYLIDFDGKQKKKE